MLITIYKNQEEKLTEIVIYTHTEKRFGMNEFVGKCYCIDPSGIKSWEVSEPSSAVGVLQEQVKYIWMNDVSEQMELMDLIFNQ